MTCTWLLRIAAVLVIAVLGGWNLLLQNDLSAARSYQQSVAAVLDTAAQPGSLTAVLAGEGGTGTGLAAVDSGGNVALAIRNLAPTSGAAVYEAWVIASDGVPVPLGGFQVGKNGTASFRASGLPTASGIVLALTLEPGPGATTPTLPIVSKGVATAAPGQAASTLGLRPGPETWRRRPSPPASPRRRPPRGPRRGRGPGRSTRRRSVPRCWHHPLGSAQRRPRP